MYDEKIELILKKEEGFNPAARRMYSEILSSIRLWRLQKQDGKTELTLNQYLTNCGY